MEGDISRGLAAMIPIIGHIQIASVPDRAEPDSGELDYGHVFGVLEALGYEAPIGAEYKPRDGTDNGLGWLSKC
jgi:hydroxypyruvate isomerase